MPVCNKPVCDEVQQRLKPIVENPEPILKHVKPNRIGFMYQEPESNEKAFDEKTDQRLDEQSLLWFRQHIPLRN